MPLPDLNSNKYRYPVSFSKNPEASPLYWQDGELIWEDLVALYNALSGGSGVSTFGALTDAYSLAGTAGTMPMTNSAGTALIPITIFDTAPVEVDAATTAALAGSPTYANGTAGVGATLTKGSNGAFPTQDGVPSTLGHRYLVKNQANSVHNGVYSLTTVGNGGTPWVLTRTTDSDTAAELDPQVVIPSLGTTNARKVYSQTTQTPVIGTSNIIYATTAVAGGLQPPLVLTEAQAQARAIAGTFITGRTYIVTGIAAAQGTCTGMFQAFSTTQLNPQGVGLYTNPAMGSTIFVNINYKLSTGFLNSIFNSERNLLYQGDGFGNMILFPFDSASMGNVTVNDAATWNVNLGTGSIFNSSFGSWCVVVMDNNCTVNELHADYSCDIDLGASATTDVQGARLGQVAVLHDNGGVISQLEMGSQAVILAPSGANFQGCTIGQSKTIDLTAFLANYSQQGKTYDNLGSNFEVSGTVLTTPDPLDMSLNSGIIDMSNFRFAGILNVSGDGSTAINQITSFPVDHNFEVRCIDNDVLVNDKSVSSGNIQLEVAGTVTLVKANGDWMEFTVSITDPANVRKVNGANYVTA